MASAYYTVSESDAILVTLLAKERKVIYRRKGENLREVTDDERQRTLTEWTARLIDNLDPWLNRTHGENDYFLTQLLSGHEVFQSYLHRIGKVRSLDSVFCNGVTDDAEHTYFFCEN